MSHSVQCFFFPPSVMKQQPSEARAMATASAALTMRSQPQDITLGATNTKDCETEASTRAHTDTLKSKKSSFVFNGHLCTLFT